MGAFFFNRQKTKKTKRSQQQQGEMSRKGRCALLLLGFVKFVLFDSCCLLLFV